MEDLSVTRLVAVWHVLTNTTTYSDLSADHFLTRDNPDRRRHRLIAQPHALGYQVALTPRIEPA